MSYLVIFGCILMAYLIGSIPTGYILVKLVKGIDIRTIGSGSTGATNVKRVLGLKGFIITMLLDGLKGIIPVFAVRELVPVSWLAPVVATMIIIGHSKSIFLHFTGGKSVASGAGTIIGLNPLAGLFTFLIWFVLTYTTKYVSVGSIVALSLAPIWMFLLHAPTSYILYCAIGAIYVIYLHRENIKRLLKGEENKVRS